MHVHVSGGGWAQPCSSHAQVVKSADVIFVAVKPQYVSVVLREVAPHVSDRHTIVSIAAGITLAALKEAAGDGARLVRVMPNTPWCVASASPGLGKKAGVARGRSFGAPV